MAVLSSETIDARLADLAGWSRGEGCLERTYQFADFAAAFGFMASVAVVAESMNHHPDWSNVYNRVEVKLSTHDAGGVTDRDFDLAAAMERFAAPASNRTGS